MGQYEIARWPTRPVHLRPLLCGFIWSVGTQPKIEFTEFVVIAGDCIADGRTNWE
jgi:hypothetical protein